LPNVGAALGEQHPPVFSLEGPVSGGGDWHQKMALELERLLPNCIVAISQRYFGEHPLMNRLLKGGVEYPSRLEWKRVYFELAAWGPQGGCIIFWFCCERKSENERYTGLKPYAMEAFGTLGRWAVYKKCHPRTRVVFGAEPEFPGRLQIHQELKMDLGPKVCLYDSLHKTVRAAVRVAAR
jgi:hypothetical protein